MQQDKQEYILRSISCSSEAHLVPDRGDDTCVPLQQEPTYRGAQFPCSQGRSLPATDVPIRRPKLPQMSGRSKLTDFIGPRSVLLFNLIGVSHKFLLEDDWTSNPDYDVTEAALRNLTPLNDSCEISVALATLFNGKMTRTESSYQELLLVVEKHRKMFTLTTK